MSALTCGVQFVPQGRASRRQQKFELTDSKYKKFKKFQRWCADNINNSETADDSINGMDVDTADADTIGSTIKAYNESKKKLNNGNGSEDEDDEIDVESIEEDGVADSDDEDENSNNNPFLGSIDEFISATKPDPELTNYSDHSEEDDEDMEILPSDSLLLVAKTSESVSNIEVCVYEHGDHNLYVHHDYLLSSMPFCIEYIYHKYTGTDSDLQNTSKNWVAVGSIDPFIEIYNIDTVGTMFPDMVLGDPNRRTREIGKSHMDAVLTLHSHPQRANILSSGSVDKTVKLWDFDQTKCLHSYDFHDSRVNSVKWHPSDQVTLASCSQNKLCISDIRTKSNNKWLSLRTEQHDIDKIMWRDSNNILAATDQGIVFCWDTRMASTSKEYVKKATVFELKAHSGAITDIALNSYVSDYFVTTGTDGLMKCWNLENDSPALLTSRHFGSSDKDERLFSVKFGADPSTSMILATGGVNAKTHMWDTSLDRNIIQKLKSKVPKEALRDGSKVEATISLDTQAIDREDEEEDDDDNNN